MSFTVVFKDKKGKPLVTQTLGDGQKQTVKEFGINDEVSLMVDGKRKYRIIGISDSLKNEFIVVSIGG